MGSLHYIIIIIVDLVGVIMRFDGGTEQLSIIFLIDPNIRTGPPKSDFSCPNAFKLVCDRRGEGHLFECFVLIIRDRRLSPDIEKPRGLRCMCVCGYGG